MQMRIRTTTLVIAIAVALCNSALAAPSPALTRAQTPKAKVDITFNGKVVTGQTSTILSGQLVTLAYTVSGASMVKHQWLVPTIVVGNFVGSVQNDALTPANYLPATLTLHWIDQGSKLITLLYTLSDGEEARVFTTFNVQGPTNVKVTTKLGTVTCFVGKAGNQVGLGNETQQNIGIEFDASATMPSAGSGAFAWVQIISSDDYSYSGPGKSYAEKSTGGLDLEPPTATTYVYKTGPWADDSPSNPLGSGADGINQMSRQFEATMYLMWLADADKNTIPVPLGYIVWYTGWDLVFNPKSTNSSCFGWTISRSLATPTLFQPSLLYPEWSHPSTIQRVQ
jgi:hypothetical protein